MRPKVWVYLACIVVICISTSTQHVFALSTSETTFPPNAPLVISAYQTINGGRDVGLVELYNDGDELIDVADWSVVDDTNKRVLQVSSRYDGFLEPGQHVVLARQDVITGGSSYDIDGWHDQIALPAVIVTLSLRHIAYKNSDITVKATNALVLRNRGVDGYLSTFTDTSYRNLFDDGLYRIPADPVGLEVDEIYPYASNCPPFDDDSDNDVLCGDYVKLVNISSAPITLDEYVLRTDSSSSNRTASNTVHLAGTIEPGAHRTVWLTDGGDALSLTNSGGYAWLEDLWGTARYLSTLAHYELAGVDKQGMAYARTGEGWVWTTTPQPDRANLITLPVVSVVECPAGKYRNPDTGRCRTVEEAVNELATCPEGQARSTETNRCRSLATLAKATLTACGEGQERNPLTGRCRSIASAVAELLPCDEGYERNLATNRCRKVALSAMPLAPYPVQPVGVSDASKMMWWVLAAVAAAALGYALWEWRRELRTIPSRVSGAMTRKK